MLLVVFLPLKFIKSTITCMNTYAPDTWHVRTWPLMLTCSPFPFLSLTGSPFSLFSSLPSFIVGRQLIIFNLHTHFYTHTIAFTLSHLHSLSRYLFAPLHKHTGSLRSLSIREHSVLPAVVIAIVAFVRLSLCVLYPLLGIFWFR